MKQLLTYLFIIFSLVLQFTINAEAKEDIVKLLKNLDQLYKDGVIDKSQFERSKKKILELNNNKITKKKNQTKNDDPDKLLKNLTKLYKDGVFSKSQYENAKKKLLKSNNTKITKKETKQEKFKPEKTIQDNEAPIIDIASTITVNDASYEIEGKVSDKSNDIFIIVDGRTITAKNGKFKIKRFSPVNDKFKIIAIDQWGNTSKPKLVNIIIDQQETVAANVIDALDPSKIKTKSSKNRVALIFGIEKYVQAPDASFANLDAKYFYEYARKGFGISKSNIKLLVDEDANLISSLGILKKWLPGKVVEGKTELIIFFAGHGLGSSDGKELYLLPQDSDPDLLTRTALSRTELFKSIIDLNPKSVTMFFDTCYSGISRDDKTLLASARPIRITPGDDGIVPDNFTIFSASQLDQISSGLKEAKHGIFSYYLMKGLEGKADSNNDNKITNGELLDYMDSKVSQKASALGRKQNPSLRGDPEKVLITYQ
ncbi:SHOCT domain-containing protein [Candidatus Pelagibacter sp.]|nr:SHOCT domain-containing protein [Candidatus Pelagibacter sp.]